MSDRLTMLVMVGIRTGAHTLRSQVGIGSESDCLLRQLRRILDISDSDAGVNPFCHDLIYVLYRNI